MKSVEGFTKIVALAQNRDPGEAGLKSVEHQLFVQRAIIVFRDAPFGVVIGDIERNVFLRPRTAKQSIGMLDRAAHDAAFTPVGISKRIQSACVRRIGMPPALSGASALSIRSSRNSANPFPPADEP